MGKNMKNIIVATRQTIDIDKPIYVKTDNTRASTGSIVVVDPATSTSTAKLVR
jgi:sulfate adenylyltransferase subunit 1 (EFTu-like GTPase family)